LLFAQAVLRSSCFRLPAVIGVTGTCHTPNFFTFLLPELACNHKPPNLNFLYSLD
jgi:hypothetical protein